ncbi:MAG TPA: hypothetical protein VLB50_07465 [Ignavibacteriaceae bacterium]|nr:hypothetical protein [Ignavibacteriaceae bacterium]
MYLKYFISITLVIMLSAYTFPQDEEAKEDSTESGWDWGEWKDFHEDMDFIHTGFHGSPAVVLGYGISGLSLNQFNGKFADPNMVELKLGYIKEKAYKNQEDIIKYNFNYLYLSNISTDLSNSNAEGLTNNTWRFGAGNSKGYGYRIGKGGVIPYYSTALIWSRLDLKEQNIPADQKELLGNFDDTFRFGTNWEGGIKFKVIPMLTIDAGYERAVIFPRHLFWKWLGSAAIETAGQWMVDGFVKEIMESSSYAGPVMSFVLKNALSYGMYELRQDKMNWPFKSAAPLAYDQFKFGFTVNF